MKIKKVYNYGMRNYDSELEFSFKLLIKTALNSDVSHKHASALLHKDIILSYGHNKLTNSLGTFSIHAEIDAITAGLYSLKKKNNKFKSVDIIVIRLNKKGHFTNSRPCSFCIQKLQELKIRKVYYSNQYGNIICEFIESMEKTHISMGDKNLNKLLK